MLVARRSSSLGLTFFWRSRRRVRTLSDGRFSAMAFWRFLAMSATSRRSMAGSCCERCPLEVGHQDLIYGLSGLRREERAVRSECAEKVDLMRYKRDSVEGTVSIC